MPSSAATTPWLVVLLAASTLQGASAQATCRAKGDCTDGQFCRYPDGACAPPGVCQEIPFVCTMDYRPHCGCDGKTYGNACGAFSASMSIRFEGECESQAPPAPPSAPQPAGGPAISSSKEHMKRDLLSLDGFNMADESLQSLLRMERDKAAASPPLYPHFIKNEEEVAGAVGAAAAANGVHASNNNNGGMGGDTRKQRCGSRGLGPCAEGEFCEFVDGLCGETDTGGFCTRQTMGCPKIYRPVCGCDGRTHANACVAKAQGISVRFEGPCAAVVEEPGSIEKTVSSPFQLPQPLADVLNGNEADGGKVQNCGGIQGLACPKGQNCIYPRGTCGAADEMGVCMSPPFICALIYQPVCGCGDAGTFSNECYAHSQGVSVAAYGPCPASTAPGQGDAVPPHQPPPMPPSPPQTTTNKEEEHLRKADGGH